MTMLGVSHIAYVFENLFRIVEYLYYYDQSLVVGIQTDFSKFFIILFETSEGMFIEVN